MQNELGNISPSAQPQTELKPAKLQFTSVFNIMQQKNIFKKFNLFSNKKNYLTS